ncbi:hypothetical protein [Cesiribacter sp. SM1]|uniref:hypothetical protein n=1 Tax=Cesiribacter sp. SM1 TaxID=2861196 RepID=UPI001CD417E2|nr:hypothetical protein [Cesiribacter sp. SM1]
MQEVNFDNHTYKFEFSDSDQCWMGRVELNNVTLDIELYLQDFQDNSINWADFEDFLQFFDHNIMESVIAKSKALLLKFYEVTGGGDKLEEYRFEFESIIYKGKRYGGFFGDPTHQYSLLFKLYRQEYIESYDPYGNYFIEIDNGLIIGCKRVQV